MPRGGVESTWAKKLAAWSGNVNNVKGRENNNVATFKRRAIKVDPTSNISHYKD
ncbi:hypothetical protein GCM10009022_20740 [Vreelandella titanicae]